MIFSKMNVHDTLSPKKVVDVMKDTYALPEVLAYEREIFIYINEATES